MKINTLVAIVVICITVMAVAGTMTPKAEVAIIDPDKKMGQWHDVLCIEEDGTADMYSIPVPEFEGFSEEFVSEYLEDSGQQFCDSIQDKTLYLHDVSMSQ